MNVFRCVGLLVIILLSACDAREVPAPKPKVVIEAPVKAPEPVAKPVVEPAVISADVAAEAGAQVNAEPSKAPSKALSQEPPPKELPAEQVHQLKPNVPVVPVVAATVESAGAKTAEKTQKAAPQPKASISKSSADKAASNSDKTASASKKATAAKKGVAAREVRAPKSGLDLSLPPEMVKQLVPAGAVTPSSRKPLLPQMFGDKDNASGRSPFELNGRLLSNEMQLQMRNDNRREVEGAALDFKFKQ